VNGEIMKFLTNFEKAIAGEEGISASAEPPRYWFSTGNYALNKIISGSFFQGLPQGRATGFVGASGTGKSYMIGNMVKEAQKQGAFCLVIDSEHALDNDYMANVGADPFDQDSYLYKEVRTYANVIKVISSFLDGYTKEYSSSDLNARKVFIALDSMDMLSTDSELKDFEKGEISSDQGLRAKTGKAMLRQFVQGIKHYNITMAVTGNVYQAKQADVLAGLAENGVIINPAIQYALSQIILFKKLKLKEKTEAEDEVIGIRMIATAPKTRFTRPFQKVELEVPYETGIDPYSGLSKVLVALGVLNKNKGWYTIPDTDIKFQESKFINYADELLKTAEELTKKQYVRVESDEDTIVDPAQFNTTKDLKLKRLDATIEAEPT
jgi:RecA/RadA recombinase